MKNSASFMIFLVLAVLIPNFAFAQDGSSAGMVAVGAGIAIGVAALGGGLGQGKAISSGLDSIGRNPSAYGKIFIPMLVGLALVESLVILSFVIAKQLAGLVH